MEWQGPTSRGVFVMGEECEAEVYDEGFSTNPKYFMSPEEAPWAAVWRAVADLVPPKKSVLDLGCGPGHLAAMIGKRETYIGIDFSRVAIAMARTRSPWADWRIRDLRTIDRLPMTQIVVCTEVLEHIRGDLRLLKRIAPLRRVIISVPTYDSRTHVRFFPTKGQAIARYKGLIRFDETLEVGDRHFVLSGRKRRR